MKQYFTDEKTGITYTLQGDYYLPNFALLAEEQEEVGLWGQKHLRYLKQNRKVIYYNLVTSEKLNFYLADINEQAESMFLRLVKKLAEKENAIEQLKFTDQMLWVQKMNNIRNRATEIVNNEIIYSISEMAAGRNLCRCFALKREFPK